MAELGSGARMSVTVADGRARLAFLPGSGVEGAVDLTLAQLSELIRALGLARAELAGPSPALDGAVQAVVGPAWTVRPEALTEGSMLAFAHPNYGPVGFVLAAADVERMVRALTSHLGMVHSGEVGEARNWPEWPGIITLTKHIAAGMVGWLIGSRHGRRPSEPNLSG